MEELPSDVIPNIVSFITDRPTFAYLGSYFNALTRDKWQRVYERMEEEYPLWKVNDFKHEVHPQDHYRYIDLYKYYLNYAALNKDWDVFIVLSFSIPTNMVDQFISNRDEMEKLAIWNARVNGNSALEQELAEKYYIYDFYYQMRSSSDDFIMQVLSENIGGISFDIYDIGWIAPNVRRVATQMYRSRTLHPAIMSNNRTLSILLGRNMLTKEEKTASVDSIIFDYMAIYSAPTLTDLIPRIDISSGARVPPQTINYIGNLIHSNKIPKNENFISYYVGRFRPSLAFDTDPILYEADVARVVDDDDILNALEVLFIWDFPLRYRLAARRGLNRNPIYLEDKEYFHYNVDL